MKKYMIILVLISALASSCKDYLDLKPKNQIVLGTLKDARLMMSSYLFALTAQDALPVTFNGKRITWPFNRDAMANFSFYSDDILMAAAMSSSYTRKYEPEYYEDGNWQGKSFANTMWLSLYTHIGYLNEVITGADKTKDEDPKMYEMVKGEALTARAFFIFKLLQLYAPYQNNELGIPLNFDTQMIKGGKRLSQKDVYKQIIDDLNLAMDYSKQNASWNIFMHKNIIHALLAQVYMFKAESAAKEADDWKNVQMNSGVIVDEYQLETTVEQIRTQFTSVAPGAIKNNPHALLILVWNTTPRSNFYSLWGTSGNNNGLTPSTELNELYTADDIRNSAYFDANGMFNKYSFSFSAADFATMFRVADLYLINAEANIRLNDGRGKQVLEAFIKNRTGQQISVPTAELLSTLLKERKKELCVEYESRWVDMKRLGLSITRKSTDSKTNQLTDYTLIAHDYRYALPIPVESELSYNNITQNPGW